jgi:hypothetical protein
MALARRRLRLARGISGRWLLRIALVRLGLARRESHRSMQPAAGRPRRRLIVDLCSIRSLPAPPEGAVLGTPAGHAFATPPASSSGPLQPLPTDRLATRSPATFTMPSARVSWPRMGKGMPIPDRGAPGGRQGEAGEAMCQPLGRRGAYRGHQPEEPRSPEEPERCTGEAQAAHRRRARPPYPSQAHARSGAKAPLKQEEGVREGDEVQDGQRRLSPLASSQALRVGSILKDQ